MSLPVLAFGMPGTTELIIIAGIALLVFGRRLPDVARSVGKSIVEFKKGIRDVSSGIEEQTHLPPPAVSKLQGQPPVSADANAAQTATSSAPTVTPSTAPSSPAADDSTAQESASP